MSRSRTRTREAIAETSERLRRELVARHPATLEARSLSLIDPEEQRAGSKPIFSLADARGNRYVLKVALPALMAAEQAAFELRWLGRRPAVPAHVATVELDGIGSTRGLLKPHIDFDPRLELAADTTTWSELQRGVVLLEQAWEWFLDNLDTNTSQYALLGPGGYPLNIDWDRSFASDATSELSRYAKYRALLPNARTFLYGDYVEGRITLDFALLDQEARRVRRLPSAEVRRVVREYGELRYADPRDSDEFVRRVLLRQANIESEVSYFIHALMRERRQFSAAHRLGTGAMLRAGAKRAWKHWQRVLNAGSRGAVGWYFRRLLSAARGRALLGVSGAGRRD